MNRLARESASELVIFDPAIPLGAIAPNVNYPTAVVLHGAEVTIPGRVPGLRAAMARTLKASSLVIAAGGYPLAEAERCAGRKLPSVVVPPGVDIERFGRPSPESRRRVRARYGIGDDDLLVASVNRLVPRKGMERLIRAVSVVRDRMADRAPASGAPLSAGGSTTIGPSKIHAVIAGTGREEDRLKRLAKEMRAPVHLPGRIDDDEVVALYNAADLMAMPCNSRWWGLEQEGFGIVFLEAAAAGIPQIAGRSGGAHEAVEHGVTGLVLDDPDSIQDLAAAIEYLADNPAERQRMGEAARRRVEEEFAYDKLALRLAGALDSCELRSPSP